MRLYDFLYEALVAICLLASVAALCTIICVQGETALSATGLPALVIALAGGLLGITVAGKRTTNVNTDGTNGSNPTQPSADSIGQ